MIVFVGSTVNYRYYTGWGVRKTIAVILDAVDLNVRWSGRCYCHNGDSLSALRRVSVFLVHDYLCAR